MERKGDVHEERGELLDGEGGVRVAPDRERRQRRNAEQTADTGNARPNKLKRPERTGNSRRREVREREEKDRKREKEWRIESDREEKEIF